MFDGLIQLQKRDNLFIDKNEVAYFNPVLVRSEEVECFGKPYVNKTIGSAKEYSELMKRLKTASPQPNAWYDAGIIEQGTKQLELPEMNLDGTTFREPKDVLYEKHRIEFYRVERGIIINVERYLQSLRHPSLQKSLAA